MDEYDRTPPYFYYYLDGKKPVMCAMEDWIKHSPNESDWMKWSIGLTSIGKYEVSTVFLGINHSCHPKEDPVLFETMIFEYDQEGNRESKDQQLRYTTYEDAEKGHEALCALVRAGLEFQTNIGEIT